MGFQFKDAPHHAPVFVLEIAELQFPIKATPELKNRVEQCNTDIQAASERMKTALSNLVDASLGDGAADRIFANHERSVENLNDLLRYIGSEFQKHAV